MTKLSKIISAFALLLITIALSAVCKEHSFIEIFFIACALVASGISIRFLAKSLFSRSDASIKDITLSEATTEAKQADTLGVDFCCGACRGESK